MAMLHISPCIRMLRCSLESSRGDDSNIQHSIRLSFEMKIILSFCGCHKHFILICELYETEVCHYCCVIVCYVMAYNDHVIRILTIIQYNRVFIRRERWLFYFNCLPDVL